MTRIFSIASSIALVLVCWLLCNWLDLAPRLLLPTPWDVIHAGWIEAENGRLANNVAVSLMRLLGGYTIGAAAGITTGIVIGSLPIMRSMLLPPLEVLRPIPPLAWIPLAIIWFGIGESSKVFLIATTAFFPVMISTFRGVLRNRPGPHSCSPFYGRWLY